MLNRLIKIARLHQAYADEVEHLTQQQLWLIELQRLLKPTKPGSNLPLTGDQVATQVRNYLRHLVQRTDLDQTDQAIAKHINATFSNRWWGLFRCYDVPGLPATNNGLEQFFGQLKTNQRRITGRKSVNRFVLRYGAFAAFVDRSETKRSLLARLQQVDPAAFQLQRRQLQRILGQRRDYHRFCHRLDTVIQELETQWAAAVDAAQQIA